MSVRLRLHGVEKTISGNFAAYYKFKSLEIDCYDFDSDSVGWDFIRGCTNITHLNFRPSMRHLDSKAHKQPKRRCLAARSHVQHIELKQTTQGNTRESTVTTSLTAAATPALVTLLRDVVDRTSKITVRPRL
jgi:hypothetical protein